MKGKEIINLLHHVVDPLLVSARIVVSIYRPNWIRTGGPISISMIQNQSLY